MPYYVSNNQRVFFDRIPFPDAVAIRVEWCKNNLCGEWNICGDQISFKNELDYFAYLIVWKK
jgi:hypothetical protein